MGLTEDDDASIQQDVHQLEHPWPSLKRVTNPSPLYPSSLLASSAHCLSIVLHIPQTSQGTRESNGLYARRPKVRAEPDIGKIGKVAQVAVETTRCDETKTAWLQ